MKPKHLHIARRKMCHVIDELYTLLLRSGGDVVDLHIRREAEGMPAAVRTVELSSHPGFMDAYIDGMYFA